VSHPTHLPCSSVCECKQKLRVRNVHTCRRWGSSVADWKPILMAVADMQNESSTTSGILNMAINFTVTRKFVHLSVG
jgi:hypothetical protein